MDGKALATASPAVLFAALIGCASILARLGTLPAAAAAGTVALGVLWSNGLAYHGATLAPHGQLAELEEIGELFAGQGPALMTEYQPYGVRHFLRRLDPEGASELRRRLVRKADGSLPQRGESPDLDELALSDVLVYRSLVLRRSPVASRPPAPYELRWQGRWYEVWQRPVAGTAVAAHLPLGDDGSPGAAAACADVRRIAMGAHTTAAVARTGPVAVLPARPSGVEEAFVVPETGRYSLWLAGSRRAGADVFIDGQRIASAPAHFDNAAEYSELGTATLGPGVHTVRVQFDRSLARAGDGWPRVWARPARGHLREPAARRDHGRIATGCAAVRANARLGRGAPLTRPRERPFVGDGLRTTIPAMSQPDDVPVGDVAAHDAPATSSGRRFGQRTLLGVSAVVAVGVGAALLAWLLIVRPSDDGTGAAPPLPSTALPEIASLADLRALTDSGQTFYWAGVRTGMRIELTAPDGTVFIRYLPSGEQAGSAAPALTVATYPRSNGFEEVSRAAEGADVTKLELPRGGLAVVDETTGTNVHLAYPGQPYQVEVYSPRVGEARRLVANATVRLYS